MIHPNLDQQSTYLRNALMDVSRSVDYGGAPQYTQLMSRLVPYPWLYNIVQAAIQFGHVESVRIQMEESENVEE